ncbi:Uma2 family endonuclease [Beijerinckia sp. L45]|uniref:Uma2 family endonuclease n=1 Tax=Beijerinckia sp. L45 TaxID=1641855 RepID=UPI00131BF786
MQEYWVIDTTKLRLTVHRAPVDGVWSSVEVLPAEAVLTHKSAPGFAIRLSQL